MTHKSVARRLERELREALQGAALMLAILEADDDEALCAIEATATRTVARFLAEMRAKSEQVKETAA